MGTVFQSNESTKVTLCEVLSQRKLFSQNRSTIRKMNSRWMLQWDLNLARPQASKAVFTEMTVESFVHKFTYMSDKNELAA